ncbi:hypothetical protein D3C71_1529270 [compost metagenome]
MASPHQRDGNADETRTADKFHLQAGGRAHDRVQRHHTCQTAGNEHGDDDGARIGNAGIDGGRGADAERAHLITELGAPDQHPDEKTHD